jgi:hypothetical protein
LTTVVVELTPEEEAELFWDHAAAGVGPSPPLEFCGTTSGGTGATIGNGDTIEPDSSAPAKKLEEHTTRSTTTAGIWWSENFSE